MPRTYATAAQVLTLVGIDGATAITLRRASEDVDVILRGAIYDVDEAGYPADPAVVDLLATMTAEQVAWYGEVGDETGIAAASGGSIGSVSLPQVGGGMANGEGMYAPRARRLARNSELLRWAVQH